ncbi:CBS domain-containing protein [Vogesella oryzae]|uniref:CBS domain-containing protein n=1 Tax=Vogesella oryzae TaxID=1735285 RepID=UPI0015826F0F|nr:CBS domain-containing protein [Vogesella oryzae]
MDYHALPGISLPVATDLIHVEQRPQRPLTLKSPAVEVLTDLRVIDPISITDDTLLEDAHARMVSHGIRLLFVTNDAGAFTGLLTASDVLGERPLKCMQGSGKQRKDLLVADVMTPRNQLEALNMVDVSHACVGHVVATLKEHGRQHALVVERSPHSGHLEICGLFSTSTIARRLGISLNFLRVPRAFSEIEHALLHEI